MISAQDYRRRMAALARAEAVRGTAGRPLPRFAEVSLARRCAAAPPGTGVDPVAVSKADGGLFFRA